MKGADPVHREGRDGLEVLLTGHVFHLAFPLVLFDNFKLNTKPRIACRRLAERFNLGPPCHSNYKNLFLPSQSGGLGEIDFEPVAFPLVSASHFGAGVAEVALDMGFLDLRGGGEAGA
jgi:hypothetical protein